MTISPELIGFISHKVDEQTVQTCGRSLSDNTVLAVHSFVPQQISQKDFLKSTAMSTQRCISDKGDMSQ